MPTREIPPAEWKDFCDAFSRRHAGWLATVEVLDPSLGAQIEARELPLLGISAEEKAGGERSIVMTLGTAPDRSVTHIVASATRLWVEETEDGAERSLEVEAPSAKTLLRFRSAMPSDMVDGIATI